MKHFNHHITIDEGEIENPVTVDCPNSADNLPTIFPVATDACGYTLDPIFKESSDFPECGGEGVTMTYTYTYTDCAGNTADWVFTYNINAPANPTLELEEAEATSAGECKYEIPAVGYTASAACDGQVTVSQLPEAGTKIGQTDEVQEVEIAVTAVDGCEKSTTVTTTVIIPAKPTVTITTDNPTACYGSDVTLEATEGFQNYSWDYLGLLTQTIVAEELTETTTFTVTATDVNGCTATATQEVTVSEIGTVTITGDD